MIPAMTSGFAASAMTSMRRLSRRSLPSRVTRRSPSRAGRTMICRPPIFLASNACTGWPVSSMTKLPTSTTLLIGRRPTVVRRSCSQAGLGPIFTPAMRCAVYSGQFSSDSTATPVSRSRRSGAPSGRPVNVTGGYWRSRRNQAASSRATPRWQSPSGRLGVISRSKTTSPGGSTSLMGVPSAGRPSRMSRPACPPGRPSSSGEHIMPSESWPRMVDCLILSPPASTAPGSATGTRSPARWLGAPQTIVFTPPAGPTSTVQTVSLSALGCLSRVNTSPTITCASGGAPVRMTCSTSKPRKVIAWTISSTVASSET